MATPYEALTQQKDKLASDLAASKTAYAPNTPITTKDFSMTNQLASVNKQIEAAKSTELRNRWYGATPSGEEDAVAGKPSESFWMKGLRGLQQPLNVIAGTAQYALGKGTESSLGANINKARETGLTFGNILQQEGAPWAASAPLGFALDVMFDPVNWLTAGSAALIPRVGIGAVKGFAKKAGVEAVESGLMGSAKGALTGLTSGLEKKAFKVMDVIPFAKKFEPYAAATTKMGERAIAGAEKFDTLVGKNVYDKLSQGALGLGKAGAAGNKIEELVRAIPETRFTPSGERIADFFKYSTKTASEIADINDQVINLAKKEGFVLVRNADDADFINVRDAFKPGAEVKTAETVKKVTDEIITDAAKTPSRKLEPGTIVRDITGVINPEVVGKVKIADTFENAQALLDINRQDVNLKNLMKAYEVTEPGKSGYSAMDTWVNRLKSTTLSDIGHFKLGEGVAAELPKADDVVRTWNTFGAVGENLTEMAKSIPRAIKAIPEMSPSEWKPFNKILNALDSYDALFKVSKVAMNPGSHVVAVIGNFFMGAMMGLPVWKPAYLNAVRNARSLVKGKLGVAGIKKMFFDDANLLIDLADNHPTRFRQLFGFDPSDIVGKITTEQKIRGAIPTKFGDVLAQLKKDWGNIEEGLAQGKKLSSFSDDVAALAEGEAELAEKVGKRALKEELGAFPVPSEEVSKLMKEAPLREAEQLGTFTTEELKGNNLLNRVKQNAANRAAENPDNLLYKAVDKLVNALPKAYEHIDQTYKIGTTDYLARVGLTEQELITVSRQVPITADDLLEPVISKGEKLYRLKPLKAADVAMETYMNYAAMPDFVRMMRSMPLLRSNFYSFAYASAIKNAKTLVNNPAGLNKISFALNEFSGTRTPEEKAAMEQTYNSYLNSPTVIKIAGMWNTDVKNVISMYGMNMFNPTQKTYDDSTQGKVLKVVDSIPVFQNPWAQVIKDYWVQPWILSGTGQVSQGTFGQPLYPSYDALGKQIEPSAGTKALYSARTLTEAVTPGVAGYAGFLGGMLPREAIELIPSYRGRAAAYAETGKSSIGAQTKENAMQKTLRALLGTTGIPAYTLDTTKLPSKLPPRK